MATTVTMSLEEFKELEGKAKAFDECINKKEVLMFHVPYGSEYFISPSLDEFFVQIRGEIKEVSELAETWRLKAIKATR